MADDFTYDVFLSHSAKDKEVVRPLAERLREDGLRIWLDDWEIRPGDSIPAKIEEGLERSRLLVLCMSAHSFGSDWATLESQAFRFRDPLNKERRFIPLRLDEAPLRGSLAQLLYIKWLPEDREQEYSKLLEACWPPATEAQTARGRKIIQAYSQSTEEGSARIDSDNVSVPDAKEGGALRVLKGNHGGILAVALSADDRFLVTGSRYGMVGVWDLGSGQCVRLLRNMALVREVVVSSSGRIYSASEDGSIQVWSLTGDEPIATLNGHLDAVYGLAFTPDEKLLVSGSKDGTIRVWDIEKATCERVLKYGKTWVNAVVVTPDGKSIVAGAEDGFIISWDIARSDQYSVLGEHTLWVWSLALASDGSRLVSGSGDSTVGLWDIKERKCLAIFEGHSDKVSKVAITPDGKWAVSGSLDRTVRIWDLNTGKCSRTLVGHEASVQCVAISGDGRFIVSGSDDSSVRMWSVSPQEPGVAPTSRFSRYTNAKVLLVGESGAGKTGLSKRLALNEWQPSDSTFGAWATQWKLPVSSTDDVEREIWLWDFGGQADQRLIHQLYMDETALAVLVFDGQKENLFETLGQWDRDLTRASRKEFAKLLVAGRVDVGGLHISRAQVESFRNERGYLQLLETSAKTNLGCEELKQAILDGIRWEDIPWRSSPLLFKRLKEEIVRLKDEGRVLMRLNELRETLILRLSGEGARFTDEELKAVVSLLAGPGVVWELKFGSWVLFQPERINAYAQAVIQTMREDEQERGCLPEERVLNGDLTYSASMDRLETDEERFVLLAMHQMLVARGLCLREHTDKGPLLIFPSYYRRERPELVGHPAVLVSYRFNGFLDDIYATLVVRLHHTRPFEQDQLWRYAADFKTLMGKQLGVKLTRRAEGAGEVEVYFDPTISLEEKIIFSRYVHEHLQQNAGDVLRLRHYVCPHCGTPVGNREVAMKKLEEGKKDILCVDCEKRIPLWDQLEELFASPETKQRVRELEKQSSIVLDNASKDRALVGEVISTVALAGQICREFNVSDHGIDMEIEFKSDAGEATGRKLYLQLMSGDSYLRERKHGAEVFIIKDERHARYWMEQAFPVLLVIRNFRGEARWMEMRDWLKRVSNDGKKPVKEIVFVGERFDVMSVRRWRDRVLG